MYLIFNNLSFFCFLREPQQHKEANESGNSRRESCDRCVLNDGLCNAECVDADGIEHSIPGWQSDQANANVYL